MTPCVGRCWLPCLLGRKFAGLESLPRYAMADARLCFRFLWMGRAALGSPPPPLPAVPLIRSGQKFPIQKVESVPFSAVAASLLRAWRAYGRGATSAGRGYFILSIYFFCTRYSCCVKLCPRRPCKHCADSAFFPCFYFCGIQLLCPGGVGDVGEHPLSVSVCSVRTISLEPPISTFFSVLLFVLLSFRLHGGPSR